MLFFVESLKENIILVQSRANEHYLCIQHNWVNRDTKFHLSHTNLVFWTKFYQKRYFWSKAEKVKITIEFGIYIYTLVLTPSFILNRQFWFFRPDMLKMLFLVQNRKTKHYHRVQHIWVSQQHRTKYAEKSRKVRILWKF